MHDRKRAVSISLLFALGLFALLIVLGSRDRNAQQFAHEQTIRYGLDMKLSWFAFADQQDFEVVQDTLHFYAGLLGDAHVNLESRWRLDHCCDDPRLRAELTGGLKWFGLQANVDFAALAQREALVARMVQLGGLQLHTLHDAHGNYRGVADLHLPIPGGDGEMLHLREAAFELRMPARNGLAPLIEEPQA